MVRDRRANENPLAHLQGVTITETDDRREWTDEELRAVVEAARSGITKLGMTGEQRAMLYLSAFYTGLRAKELASLTPSHFELSANPATVTIEKADEKSRRGKSLPLHPDFAAMIQSWMSGKPTDQLLWRGAWARHRYGNKMVQFDQENAGVKYRTNEGRADFHALRHTFLSRLGRSGASTRIMMDLGRHTTPQMTMRYTHANLYDLAGAIEAVPGVSLEDQRNVLMATGTDDELSSGPNRLTNSLTKKGAEQCHSVPKSVVGGIGSGIGPTSMKKPKTLENTGVSTNCLQAERGGFSARHASAYSRLRQLMRQ